MFGAYQAGVWKILSREFAPDIVVGASVGALNGWLIAGGSTGAELAEVWLQPASGALMTYRKSWVPWNSVFDPRPLRERAKHLIATYQPKVDYGATLVRVPWLRPVLVRGPDVTWKHLVASCSVPGGFPPVRIGSSVYCDGGLLDATPIWAAAAMGADRVIAVNASRFIQPPAVRVMVSGVRLLGRRRRSVPSGLDVTLITPQDYLGKMLDGATWRKDRIERWIELGESDARTALSGLRRARVNLTISSRRP
jgi:NTE family protein